eukprot:g2174.t1
MLDLSDIYPYREPLYPDQLNNDEKKSIIASFESQFEKQKGGRPIFYKMFKEAWDAHSPTGMKLKCPSYRTLHRWRKEFGENNESTKLSLQNVVEIKGYEKAKIPLAPLAEQCHSLERSVCNQTSKTSDQLDENEHNENKQNIDELPPPMPPTPQYFSPAQQQIDVRQNEIITETQDERKKSLQREHPKRCREERPASPFAEGKNDNFPGKRRRLEEVSLSCNANKAIRFQQHNSKVWFHPTFTHQIFEEERIAGIPENCVSFDVKISPSFDVYLTCKVTSSIDKNVEKKIAEAKKKIEMFLPAESETSINSFLDKCAKKGNRAPPGKPIGKWGDFEMRLSCLSSDSNASLLHERWQCLATFFIDGASNIDLNDDRWEVVTCYRLVSSASTSSSNQEYTYQPVAYCTLFTTTNPLRRDCPKSMKICQMLVMPTFQKQGIGRKFFQKIYEVARERNVFEVNVEDPSVVFRRLRDSVDVFHSHENGIFTEKQAEVIIKSANFEEKLSLTKEQMLNAHQCLRITNSQIIRCHEAFLFHALHACKEEIQEEKRKMLRLYMKRKFFHELMDRNFKFRELGKEERKIVLQEKFEASRDYYNQILQGLKKHL